MIQNASPQRLLVMLYDRLLLDLQRAIAAGQEDDWAGASAQLVHARAIVSELISTLEPEAWDGGPDLLALYLHLSRTILSADTGRNIELTRQAVDLVRPLHDAWSQAAEQVAHG